jgi:phosphatidylglycerol---prolipoprotein diacylglyceryl transferase
MFTSISNRFNFSINNYQRLSLFFGLFFILVGIIIFYPLQQIFAGNWLLKQQITFKLLEPNLVLKNIFSGIFTVRLYALCILGGLLSGYTLALYIAKKHFIASTVIDRLLIGMVIFGLVGARLFFIIFHLDFYKTNPALILNINQGGIAFFGMLIATVFYLWVYCRKFKFSIFEFLDILTLPLLLGQIFGRFGNFFNYESYGYPTPVYWKMFVPDAVNFYSNINQKFFHPTFLYEIIPNCCLLVLLMWFYGDMTKKRSGIVFAFYGIGYGLIRFMTEFFRIDALIVTLPRFLQYQYFDFKITELKISQISALLLFIIGIYLYKNRSKVIYLKKTMVELRTRSSRKIIFN